MAGCFDHNIRAKPLGERINLGPYRGIAGLGQLRHHDLTDSELGTRTQLGRIATNCQHPGTPAVGNRRNQTPQSPGSKHGHDITGSNRDLLKCLQGRREWLTKNRTTIIDVLRYTKQVGHGHRHKHGKGPSGRDDSGHVSPLTVMDKPNPTGSARGSRRP